MENTTVNAEQVTTPIANAEPTKVTAPSSETPKVDAPKEDNMKMLAEIKRQQKEAARMFKAAQERQAKLEAREKEVEEILSWKEKAKKNPLAAIKEFGYDYQDITNQQLNEERPTPEILAKRMDMELEQIRKENEERFNKQVESEKQRLAQEQEAFITDFKSQIVDYVSENKDKYELIETFQQQDKIFSKIDDHFKETKKILSMSEASALVEKDLEEFVEMAMKTKKISGKLSPKQEEKQELTKEQSKTLTNMAASSSAPSMLSGKTEQDRLKRALAALGV